jgi:hypothetical protein
MVTILLIDNHKCPELIMNSRWRHVRREEFLLIQNYVVHTSSLRRSWRIYAGIILYTSSFSHCMQFMTF